jgi:hypothetical protein
MKRKMLTAVEAFIIVLLAAVIAILGVIWYTLAHLHD